MRLIYILAVFIFFISSCSNFVRVAPPLEALDSDSNNNHYLLINQLSEVKIDKFNPNDTKGLNLEIVDENIFIATPNGDLHKVALSESAFKKIWQIKFSSSITSGPDFYKDGVIVGTAKGDIFLINQFTSEIIWHLNIGEEITSYPTLYEDSIIIQTSSNSIYKVNLINGSISWQASSTGLPLSIRGSAKIQIYKNKVITGWTTGEITAYDFDTGQKIWSTSLGIAKGRNDIDRISDIQAQIKIVDDKLYALGFQTNLGVFNPNNGEKINSTPLSGITDFVIDTNINLLEKTNYIFIATAEDSVIALDKRNLKIVWQNNKLKGREINNLLMIKDFLIVFDSFGYVHMLDKRTGKTADRVKLSDKNDIGLYASFVKINSFFNLDDFKKVIPKKEFLFSKDVKKNNIKKTLFNDYVNVFEGGLFILNEDGSLRLFSIKIT